MNKKTVDLYCYRCGKTMPFEIFGASPDCKGGHDVIKIYARCRCGNERDATIKADVWKNFCAGTAEIHLI